MAHDRKLVPSAPWSPEDPEWHRRLAHIVESAHEGVVSVDRTQTIVYVNRGAERLFGYARNELLGRSLATLVPGSLRSRHQHHVRQFASSGDVSRMMSTRPRVMGLRKDRREFPAEVSLLRHDAGDGPIYTAIIWDMSDQVRAQREISLEKAHFEAMFQGSPNAILMLDAADRVMRANRSFTTLFGYSTAEVLSHPLRQLIVPEGLEAEAIELTTRAVGGEGTQIETRRHRKDGTGLDVIINVTPVTVDGAVVGVQAIYQDISRRKAMERERAHMLSLLETANAQLRSLVDRDPLTGLLGRRGLESRLAVEVERARRSGSPMLALLIDCDNFKRINDKLGFTVGDHVLSDLARRIADSVRPSDHVGRIGGDEFLVLLPETGYWEGARVAERIRLATEPPVITPTERVNLTVSLGVCGLPSPTYSLEELVGLAHATLRKSKAAGKNRTTIDSSGPGSTDWPSADQVSALTRQETYVPVAQPIVRLADGAGVAHELLARTRVEGLEMPDDFLRIAQDRGMLTLVDLLCLRACLDSAKRFRVPGTWHLNLFPSTILNTPAARILDLFDAYDAGDVCIEISEQQFFENSDTLRQRLGSLRDAGVHLAIDDVGFGRSSLELLLLLSPDVVKIDRRFVAGSSRDKGRLQALRRLVDVIRSVASVPIAEGVEHRDDLDVVRSLSIELAQGFLVGRPVELGDPQRTECVPPNDDQHTDGAKPTAAASAASGG